MTTLRTKSATLAMTRRKNLSHTSRLRAMPTDVDPSRVIDVTSLLHRNCSEDVYTDIGREIVAQCRATGFFSVSLTVCPDGEFTAPDACLRALSRAEYVDDDVSILPETSDPGVVTFEDCRTWFARSPVEKSKYALVDGRGYQRLGENVTENAADQHEAIDYYRPYAVREPGTLKGPHVDVGDDALNARVDARAVGSMRLGRALLRAIARYLERDLEGMLKRPIESLVDRSFWILRLIHSTGISDDDSELDEKMSCGAHTDYGFLSFLQATHAGLQVKHEDGKWVNAPHGDDVIVCNIGEMLELWTDGALKATRHRVIRRRRDSCSKESRYSIAFFYEPNYDAVIDNNLTGTIPSARIRRVRYADFLNRKVASNFQTVA